MGIEISIKHTKEFASILITGDIHPTDFHDLQAKLFEFSNEFDYMLIDIRIAKIHNEALVLFKQCQDEFKKAEHNVIFMAADSGLNQMKSYSDLSKSFSKLKIIASLTKLFEVQELAEKKKLELHSIELNFSKYLRAKLKETETNEVLSSIEIESKIPKVIQDTEKLEALTEVLRAQVNELKDYYSKQSAIQVSKEDISVLQTKLSAAKVSLKEKGFA